MQLRNTLQPLKLFPRYCLRSFTRPIPKYFVSLNHFHMQMYKHGSQVKSWDQSSWFSLFNNFNPPLISFWCDYICITFFPFVLFLQRIKIWSANVLISLLCHPINWYIFFLLILGSLESHNQWGRPGVPQGATMGSSGEEVEGEGNSLISQTVAMAIAGTPTASPMSRPSSFLLNSQVSSCFDSNLYLRKQSQRCISKSSMRPLFSHHASFVFFSCVAFVSVDSSITAGESSAW